MTDTDESQERENGRIAAQRARAGDAAATEWLVERLALVPAFLRSRNARLRQPLAPEELDDVVQETLTTIWNRLDRFEGRSSIDTWICGFALNGLRKAIERRARRRRLADLDDVTDIVDPAEAPEEATIDPIHVEEAIETIGPPASDVIRMRHFEDLTFEEIARRSGSNENTVKARYYRGLGRLKELLNSRWTRGQS